MEAERLYTKQPSRTIQQKRGGEGGKGIHFARALRSGSGARGSGGFSGGGGDSENSFNHE